MNTGKKIIVLAVIGVTFLIQPLLQGRGGNSFGGAFAGSMVGGLMTGAMQPRERTVVVEKDGNSSGAISSLRDEIDRLRRTVRQDLENLQRAIQENRDHISRLQDRMQHIGGKVKDLEE